MTADRPDGGSATPLPLEIEPHELAALRSRAGGYALLDVRDVVGLVHADHALGHRVVHADLGELVASLKGAQTNVAIGDDADDLVVSVDDGDAADVILEHDARRGLAGLTELHGEHVRRHHFRCVHEIHLPS